MKSLLWIMVVAVCVVGGPVLLLRGLAPVPALEDLDLLSGEISALGTTERGLRTDDQFSLALRVGSMPDVFEYPDWFPDAELMTSLLSEGDHVLLHVDIGRRDWIWQIEKGGVELMSYSRVRAAVAKRRLLDAGVGGLMLLLAFTGVWRMRPRRPRPS